MKWFTRNKECESGQAIVEFALILPLLLLILLLPIDFYRCINTKMILNSAASESLCQADYASVANGTLANDLMDTIRATYGDQLDAGRVTVEKLDLGAKSTETYTYYVYSSDKADPGNFWNQFESRPSSYEGQHIELQLSYEVEPITIWGEMFLGTSYQVKSRSFSRTIYAGGYTTP